MRMMLRQHLLWMLAAYHIVLQLVAVQAAPGVWPIQAAACRLSRRPLTGTSPRLIIGKFILLHAHMFLSAVLQVS